MTTKNGKRNRVAAFSAVAVAFSLLAATPGAFAEPIYEWQGVAEVGTVDPTGSSSGDNGGSGSGTGPLSGSSTDSTCLIPSWSGCLFSFDEEEAFESEHSDATSWYYYDTESVDRSGYYVDLMEGTVFMRAAAGEESSGSGSGATADSLDHEWDYYANNLGYSNENLDHSEYAMEEAEEEFSSVSRTTAEAAVDTDAGGATLDLVRDQDGNSGDNANHESSGMNHSYTKVFGITLLEEEDEQANAMSREAQYHWNRTTANGRVFLVNPLDSTTVEVIGLSLDKGDDTGSGEGSSSSSSSSSTSVIGLEVFGTEDSESNAYEYAFWNQWLHLVVDLADGTVTGDLAYDRGESSSESESSESSVTEVVGLGFGSDSWEYAQSESEWRRLSFDLDAASGAAVLDFDMWDESSDSFEAQEDNIIAFGFPLVGTEGESTEHYASDGSAIGLNVGEGTLWLGARYENRTYERDEYTDVTLFGSPLAGLGQSDYERRREVVAAGGSDAAGTSASVFYENVTEESSTDVRLFGDDFAGYRGRDEYVAYGGDANAADGVFVFHLLYREGHSQDEVHIAGFPIGLRDDYQEFDLEVGGAAPNPNGGNVLVYSFEHEEKADDYTLYFGDTDIGHFQYNQSRTAVNMVVLDGVAGADAERDFWNAAVFFGDDFEVGDVSAQTAEANAYAGDASVGVNFLFGYAEAADAIAVGVLLATCYINPGVAIPWSTVVNAVPDPTARAVVGTAVGVAQLALCGLPVFAPVPFFLLSPCILVPVVHATGFAVVGATAGTLPTVGGTAAGLVGFGGDYTWELYQFTNDINDGCVWLTIPDEARNPQPVLWAMSPANGALSTALATAFPHYDWARNAAFLYVDALFNADALLENPDGIASPDELAGSLPSGTDPCTAVPGALSGGTGTASATVVTVPVAGGTAQTWVLFAGNYAGSLWVFAANASGQC